MSWSSEPYFPARCLVSVLSFSCWLLSFNTPSRPADNCRMTNSFRIKFCNVFDRSGVLSVICETPLVLCSEGRFCFWAQTSQNDSDGLCAAAAAAGFLSPSAFLFFSFSFLKHNSCFRLFQRKNVFFFSFNYLVCTLVISSMMSHIY